MILIRGRSSDAPPPAWLVLFGKISIFSLLCLIPPCLTNLDWTNLDLFFIFLMLIMLNDSYEFARILVEIHFAMELDRFGVQLVLRLFSLLLFSFLRFLGELDALS